MAISLNNCRYVVLFMHVIGGAIAQRFQNFVPIYQKCYGIVAFSSEIECMPDHEANSDDTADMSGGHSFPSTDANSAEHGGERVGDWIGPYKLITVLGEGGFGVVYLAERREPLIQRVAIKIIKPGMDSKSVVARFEQERQVLAMMDHPHIARAIDAGTTDRGLPYFVMEFVKGEPITAFCDRQRMSVHKRLKLFAQVCDAVQHAHMRGLIHRDIKPSNILVAYDVDASPQVKVIDFGVAKALSHRLTEHTVLTYRGEMIGTPEYMSPEQAEMSGVDIDSRSDIYSLGVLLYELLIGLLPFDSKVLRQLPFSQVQHLIRNEEVPRPSTRLGKTECAASFARARSTDVRTLMGVLRGELDWVVMKCLEKDRSRRYDTPQELAGDLRRYLDELPVLARPPSTAYRIGKAIERSRALERLALCIRATVSLVLGICVVSILLTTLDALASLSIFGEYGDDHIDFWSVIRMNVYGAIVCGLVFFYSFRLARAVPYAAMISVVATGAASAWAISLLAGWCPYTAGGLLEDDRVRTMFAYIYTVIFSILFGIALVGAILTIIVCVSGRRH